MDIDTNYFAYSMISLLLVCLLGTIFSSLRFTGDAGLPRLIERGDRKIKQLSYWQDRWNLLCKTTRLLLTLSAIATFILFYMAFRGCPRHILALSIFILSLVYMLVARVIPHVLSESYADRISLAALPLVGIFTLVLYAFVWLYS